MSYIATGNKTPKARRKNHLKYNNTPSIHKIWSLTLYATIYAHLIISATLDEHELEGTPCICLVL